MQTFCNFDRNFVYHFLYPVSVARPLPDVPICRFLTYSSDTPTTRQKDGESADFLSYSGSQRL